MSKEEWFVEEMLEENNSWLRRFQKIVDDVLLASGIVTTGQLRAMEDDVVSPSGNPRFSGRGFVLLACINYKQILNIAVRLYFKFIFIVYRTFQ